MEDNSADYKFKEEALPFVVFNPEQKGILLLQSLLNPFL